jgi:hypothetical protein
MRQLRRYLNTEHNTLLILESKVQHLKRVKDLWVTYALAAEVLLECELGDDAKSSDALNAHDIYWQTQCVLRCLGEYD